MIVTPDDRQRLVGVLVAHQRHTAEACLCGWSVLGASHAEHVVDMMFITCPAALNIRGEQYRCDSPYGHDLAHTNSTAGAIWTDDPNNC